MKEKKINSILQGINKDFIKKNSTKVKKKDFEKVIKLANSILEKAERIPIIGRYISVIKTMISLVRDYHSGNYTNIPYWSISSIVFALLYFFSPIDLIPDQIPVVGYLDDALVLELCISLVENDLDDYKKFKSQI